MKNRAILLSITSIVISIIAISVAILPLVSSTPLQENSIPLTTTSTPIQSNEQSALSITSGTSNDASTILVNGLGMVKAKPDTVYIYMGVFTEDIEVQIAVEKNAEIFHNILSALSGVGIAKENIETVSYNINPVYEYPRDGSRILRGFKVDHQIAVKIDASDVNELGAKAGEAIDAAFSSGANELMRISFTVSDLKAKDLAKEARSLAVAEAADKAKTIADGLGVTITGVQQAIETGYYSPPTPTRDVAAEAYAKAPTEILPGSLTISVSVQVTFLID